MVGRRATCFTHNQRWTTVQTKVDRRATCFAHTQTKQTNAMVDRPATRFACRRTRWWTALRRVSRADERDGGPLFRVYADKTR